MDRKEISGIARELDEALEKASGAGRTEGKRTKAWKEPLESEDRMPDEAEIGQLEESLYEIGDELEEEPEPGDRGNRLSRIFLPSDGLIAAFFIPVLIMVIIFAQRGIFPFGEETFLRTDMYHQYAPFFSEFRHKLTGGGSLLYSWDVGMGVNFSALYAYYLASPLNWLVLLCPSSLIIEFMTCMIVVKTGLAGLSFAYYLREHNHFNGFGVGFFGIFYAMSGYMAAYSWNIMWLDCILLFPLIMLGLERLVHEKKGILYCVSLGVSILSNYYISIMICLFMVVYYFCLLILEERKSWKDYAVSALQFGGYSLLAGALAAVVLLPEVAALQSTASGEFHFPKTLEMYFPILDMLARHIGNVQTETGLDHWPNIYCGVAVYLFFLLYLACRKIPRKEKAVYCGLLLFFFASFSVNMLNFIWHGFHYPNSLPCRQSFIYVFLMLSMCFRAFQYLRETPKRHIAVAFWGSVCFVLLAQKLVTDEAYHFSVFYVAILFLAVYTGILYFYKNPRHTAAAAALLAMVTVGLEAGINMTVTSVTTTSRTAYTSDNDDVRRVTEDLREEGEFYRIDKRDARTKNDGAWMNFPSASLFSSLASADMTAFFKSVGCEGSTNAYSIVGSTPLVDSLFSLKYALYKGKQENPRLSLYAFSGETYLYENPWTLPLGFILPDILETGWKRDLPTPVDVQNEWSILLDLPAAFEMVMGDNDGGIFRFTAEADGEYYIYVANRRVDTVGMTVGEETRTIENVGRGFLIETGFLKAGETVSLENRNGSEELKAQAYRFCEEGLQAVYERLNRNPLTLRVWEDDHLEGEIDAGEGGTLFLSIPYDEGWTIQVDGRKMITRPIWDAFTGLEVAPGRHTVVMTYEPKGLKPGACLSGAALFLLGLTVCIGRGLRNKKKEKRRQA